MLLVLPFAAIHWVPEERVTLFTADGLIQIGGNLVPRRISSDDVCSFCKTQTYNFGL